MMRAGLVLAALCVASCVPPYRPPTLDEPHAMLKVRRTYEHLAGTTLAEHVDIDEHRAYGTRVHPGAAQAPRIDALIVHPTPATVLVGAAFSHQELRLVQESYTERVPYQDTDHYDCSTGFGSNKVHRTCTRSVTKYRSETKYRWVHKDVEVSDGSCATRLGFAPVAGRVYLVQYTFHGHAACSLSCFEQVPLQGGLFQNLPCPAPPP